MKGVGRCNLHLAFPEPFPLYWVCAFDEHERENTDCQGLSTTRRGQMSKGFPDPVRRLPKVDIPLRGVTAYLSQGDDHQILFMEFSEDTEVPEHAHGAQWGIVLTGRIELTIGGETRSFVKGEQYYIPAGTVHSARISAGYSDISFFDERARYRRGDDT